MRTRILSLFAKAFRQLCGAEVRLRSVPKARAGVKPTLEQLVGRLAMGDALAGYLVTGMVGLLPIPDPLANVMGLTGSTGYPTGAEDLSIVPALPASGIPVSSSDASPNAGVQIAFGGTTSTGVDAAIWTLSGQDFSGTPASPTQPMAPTPFGGEAADPLAQMLTFWDGYTIADGEAV